MKLLLLALAALFILAGYTRSDYGHWIDSDHNCRDTRQEVLIAESLEPVKFDKKGCKVISGLWLDNYSGKYFTKAREIDIDHLVPISEVDKSGGAEWSNKKKLAYYNDLVHGETLIAVSAKQNRSKGDKTPSEWLPPNKDYHAQYIKDWVKVKKTWQLKINKNEITKND